MKIYRNDDPGKCWIRPCTNSSSYRLEMTIKEYENLLNQFPELSHRTEKHPFEKEHRYTWICLNHLLKFLSKKKRLINQIIYERI